MLPVLPHTSHGVPNFNSPFSTLTTSPRWASLSLCMPPFTRNERHRLPSLSGVFVHEPSVSFRHCPGHGTLPLSHFLSVQSTSSSPLQVLQSFEAAGSWPVPLQVSQRATRSPWQSSQSSSLCSAFQVCGRLFAGEAVADGLHVGPLDLDGFAERLALGRADGEVHAVGLDELAADARAVGLLHEDACRGLRLVAAAADADLAVGDGAASVTADMPNAVMPSTSRIAARRRYVRGADAAWGSPLG